MIIPSNKYPGEVDTTDPQYPYGKAQASAYDGDPSGTPFAKDDLNDRWGFQAALLASVGATPTGDPETQGNSQLVSAIKQLIEEAKPASSTWAAAAGLPIGLDWDVSGLVYWGGKIYIVGSTDLSNTGVIGVSDDLGSTFSFQSGLPYYYYGLATSDAEMIAPVLSATANEYILRTLDGVSWTEHTPPTGGVGTGGNLAISQGSWIVQGSSDSLWSSSNQGSTWTNVTPAGITGINSVRDISGAIYVCHSTGITRSLDKGVTWAPLNISSQDWDDVAVYGIFIMAVSKVGVYKSAYSNNFGQVSFIYAEKCPGSVSNGELGKVMTTDGTAFTAIGAGGIYTTVGGGAPFVLQNGDLVGKDIISADSRSIIRGDGGMIVYTG